MGNTTYLSLANARIYLGLAVGDATSDDVLIQDLLNAAAEFLEGQTAQTFVPVTGTRYYDPTVDVTGHTLHLDTFLITVTTLTNGDGVEIPSSAYILLEPNQAAKRAIKLKEVSGVTYGWTYSTDHENAISVVGTWGLFATVPADVVQYMRRMVGLLYAERNSARFESTAYIDGGRLVLPQGVPAFAREVIRTYRDYL